MRKTFNVAVDESEENLHWNDLKKAAVVKSQPKKQKKLTVNIFQKPSTNNEVVAKLTASRKSINTSSSNSSLNSSSKSNNLSASKTLLISSLKNKTSTSTTGKASSSTIFTPIPRNVSDMVADTYDDYDQVNTTTNSGVGFDVGSLRNSELFDDDADATYLSNTCETDDNIGQFRSTRNAIEMAVDDNQIITETVQSDDDEVDLDDDGDDLKWIRSIPKNYDDRDEILEIIKVIIIGLFYKEESKLRTITSGLAINGF